MKTGMVKLSVPILHVPFLRSRPGDFWSCFWLESEFEMICRHKMAEDIMIINDKVKLSSFMETSLIHL
jgi:hypothetical protein